ncbi:MAG: ATP-binding protein [Pseudomonadota bacterium]
MRSPPARIALIYLVFSAVWVFFSDRLLLMLVTDTLHLAEWQTIKGLAFVLITAGLIFWLLRRELAVTQRANVVLQLQEKRLRKITDTISVAVFIHHGGRLRYVNPQAIAYSGYSEAALLNMDLWDLVHPDYRAMVMDRSQARLYDPGGRARYELKIITRPGEERWLEITADTIDFEGIPAGLATAYDITERKRAEAALRLLNQELEQRVAKRTADLLSTNQELEAFSYSVSHDLRAPLRAIQGFTQALLEDHAGQLDTSGQDFAQRIHAAANRLDGLIQDLLSYSRLSRSEIRLKPINLDNVVAEAIAQHETEIHDTAARLEVASNLPVVIGHHATLVQVISNLLSNALKFVAPGITPQIRIWAEVGADNMKLFIADNGIGIDPAHQQRIFQVFERLHGIETYPGTGIGLAIVNKGVIRMGGEVGVTSSLGQGSQFWIRLQIEGRQ